MWILPRNALLACSCLKGDEINSGRLNRSITAISVIPRSSRSLLTNISSRYFAGVIRCSALEHSLQFNVRDEIKRLSQRYADGMEEYPNMLAISHEKSQNDTSTKKKITSRLVYLMYCNLYSVRY